MDHHRLHSTIFQQVTFRAWVSTRRKGAFKIVKQRLFHGLCDDSRRVPIGPHQPGY